MSQAQGKEQFAPALLADLQEDADPYPYDDPAHAEMYELKWQRHLEWLAKGVTEQLGTLHRALALETVTRGNDSEAAIALREQIKELEAKQAEYKSEMGVTADAVNSDASARAPDLPEPDRKKKVTVQPLCGKRDRIAVER
ncbi:MAG: hypothetical protein WKG03_00840, partial [Telluria sp.]